MWKAHSLVAGTFVVMMATVPHCLGQGPAPGTADGRSVIPAAPGWYEIPGTELQPHCPSEAAIQGNSGCRSVIDAWNSGVADTRRNRLIFWGGGHADYFGNEVYALDLKERTIVRLTEPSPVTNVNECPEAYSDGRPSSRHTYGGLAYAPRQDAMFSFGGSKSNCGAMSMAIWRFDLSSLAWSNLVPNRGAKLYYAPGITSDFDPKTGAIYVSDRQYFFRYDPDTNTLTRLVELPDVDYHLNGVIDPGRELFLMMGSPGQLWSIEIGLHSSHSVRDWSGRVRGCEKLLHANFPGLSYDPARRMIVGWVGGDSVILFDTREMRCSEETYPGGPGRAQEAGTGGRFRYFPDLGVFALVNNWKQNAYLLRLNKTGEEADSNKARPKSRQ